MYHDDQLLVLRAAVIKWTGFLCYNLPQYPINVIYNIIIYIIYNITSVKNINQIISAGYGFYPCWFCNPNL